MKIRSITVAAIMFGFISSMCGISIHDGRFWALLMAIGVGYMCGARDYKDTQHKKED